MSQNSSLDEISVNTAVSDSDSETKLTIIQLIEDMINLKSTSSDTNTSTDRGFITMNVLLKHKLNILYEIDKEISVILKNKKIDMGDIPAIILLIKHIANMYSPELRKLKITRDDFLQFIRDLLVIIINSELSDIKNKDQCIQLIDTSVNLLDTSLDMNETMRCCCFGKKR
jgi:hypothetical protein